MLDDQKLKAGDRKSRESWKIVMRDVCNGKQVSKFDMSSFLEPSWICGNKEEAEICFVLQSNTGNIESPTLTFLKDLAESMNVKHFVVHDILSYDDVDVTSCVYCSECWEVVKGDHNDIFKDIKSDELPTTNSVDCEKCNIKKERLFSFLGRQVLCNVINSSKNDMVFVPLGKDANSIWNRAISFIKKKVPCVVGRPHPAKGFHLKKILFSSTNISSS